MGSDAAAGYIVGLVTRKAQVDAVIFWWEMWGDKYITDVMASVKSRKPKEFASLKADVVHRWRGQKKAAPKDGEKGGAGMKPAS